MKMRACVSALIAASTYLLALCVMLFVLPLEGHRALAAQRWRVATPSSSSPTFCGSPRSALALCPPSSLGFPQAALWKRGFQALEFPRTAPARATLGAPGCQAQPASKDIAIATLTSIAPVALSQAGNTNERGYQQVPRSRRAPS